MASTNKTPLQNLLILVAILLFITSCGSVNRRTRAKKIPREYSMNYCGGEIKAPKTDINKKPWIVYSDRSNNITYNIAGGKVKAQDVDYLDAFIVIGKKKEYLKLIKYTPDVIKNGKLDYKKAEYYGWMHKSRLLLNFQSETDLATHRKNKMIIALQDTIGIHEPEKYFANDEVIVYKDLSMEEKAGTVGMYTIVYPLKQSDDRSKTLIAIKDVLTPDGVQDEVAGWIDNSLLQHKGQILHVDPATIHSHKIQLVIQDKITTVSEETEDLYEVIPNRYATVKYAPVYSYGEKNQLTAIKTAYNIPVLDYNSNYVFNVNGGHITYSAFRNMSRKLKQINVVFVFDGKQHTLRNFPKIVNAIQNLEPLFNGKEEGFTYRFGCVMDFDTRLSSSGSLYKELDPDYSRLVNFLSARANRSNDLQPIENIPTWGNINKAIDLIKDDPEATNLIVMIGETGDATESIPENMGLRLHNNNCRIVGFQVFAGEDNTYNNFVLNLESMINAYADKMLQSKGNLQVSSNQRRYSNNYTESGDMANGYRLDFPANSITQGAVFFPQKGNSLPLEVLVNNVDTIVRQIKEDNNCILDHITSTFLVSGNNGTDFDTLFKNQHNMASERIPSKSFISTFTNTLPGWTVPLAPILLFDSQSQDIQYKLLLNEKEMQDLKEFIGALSKYEVDYYDTTYGKKMKKRKPCNCPEDDIFEEIERLRMFEAMPSPAYMADIEGEQIALQIPEGQKQANLKYVNTKKVRKHLYNLYIDELSYCKICKEKKKQLKKLTLAEAQSRITHSPLQSEELEQYKVKDLKSKRRLPDARLDELVNYFEEKKSELDKAEKFDSAGEPYYWLDMNLLP